MLMTKRTYFTMTDCLLTIAGLSDILAAGDYKIQVATYLFNKYQYNWIIYTDTEVIGEDDTTPTYETTKLQRWETKLKLIYDLTRDKYETLLKYYASYKDKLMDKIGSTTSVKFNDTPQNTGDFSAETYTSTYTETNTEVNDKNYIAKLSEIQDLYNNVFASWLEEFKGLFGEDIL